MLDGELDSDESEIQTNGYGEHVQHEIPKSNFCVISSYLGEGSRHYLLELQTKKSTAIFVSVQQKHADLGESSTQTSMSG